MSTRDDLEQIMQKILPLGSYGTFSLKTRNALLDGIEALIPAWNKVEDGVPLDDNIDRMFVINLNTGEADLVCGTYADLSREINHINGGDRIPVVEEDEHVVRWIEVPVGA